MSGQNSIRSARRRIAALAVLCLFLTLSGCAETAGPPQQTAAPTPILVPTMDPVPVPSVEIPLPTVRVLPGPDAPPEPEPGAMLQCYRQFGLAARPEIEEALAALREQDPALGELWTGIFREMFYVNLMAEVPETVPEGLPEDDSLCIVVFGYCLHPDGTMSGELVGRCEAALACARAYPNAYLALTGGPTAADNPHATEAGMMDWYLTEHGVAEERLILEKRSLSTADNAVNLDAILAEDYPQIKSLVIVSSSYHVPLCRLLMTETALFDAYERGNAPYEVAAVMGYHVAGRGDWEAPSMLAGYVSQVAAQRQNGK